jgi:tight adherence protein B
LIITLLPVAAAAFLFFVVPDYFRPMFTNPLGWVILAIATALLVMGNLIIRRITAIV